MSNQLRKLVWVLFAAAALLPAALAQSRTGILGDWKPGDTASVSVGDRVYSYTIRATDNWSSVRAALLDLINTSSEEAAIASAGSTFNRIHLRPKTAGPLASKGNGAAAADPPGEVDIEIHRVPEASRPAAPRLAKADSDYRIAVGDVLQIVVWKEPDASVDAVQVRQDGKITLPFVKELEVRGLTPPEVEWTVTQQLTRFIRNPEVSVLVKEMNSDKIYVLGAVHREGSIALRSSMTVLQALAEAGGLTDWAKKKKIYILRTEKQRQIKLPFNYEAAIRGEGKEHNLFVSPGDTIVVPQ